MLASSIRRTSRRSRAFVPTMIGERGATRLDDRLLTAPFFSPTSATSDPLKPNGGIDQAQAAATYVIGSPSPQIGSLPPGAGGGGTGSGSGGSTGTGTGTGTGSGSGGGTGTGTGPLFYPSTDPSHPFEPNGGIEQAAVTYVLGAAPSQISNSTTGVDGGGAVSSNAGGMGLGFATGSEQSNVTQTLIGPDPSAPTTGVAGFGVVVAETTIDSLTYDFPNPTAVFWASESADSAAISNNGDWDDLIPVNVVLRDPSGANLSGNVTVDFTMTLSAGTAQFERDAFLVISSTYLDVVLGADPNGGNLTVTDPSTGTTLLHQNIDGDDGASTTIHFQKALPPVQQEAIYMGWQSTLTTHPQGTFQGSATVGQVSGLTWSLNYTAG